MKKEMVITKHALVNDALLRSFSSGASLLLVYFGYLTPAFLILAFGLVVNFLEASVLSLRMISAQVNATLDDGNDDDNTED